MCIGVPVRVLSSAGFGGLAETRAGESLSIDLALLGPQPPGTWVLLHAGTALRVLDEDEAARVLDALEGARLAASGADFAHLFADLIDREPTLPPHLRPPTTH
jgi:hydrogenase expression/formation protein HypC